MISQFENGNLFAEKDWQDYIDSLKSRSLNQSLVLSKESVKKAIINAVKKRIPNSIIDSIQNRIPNRKFGIFLSGGVDSSLIAFICKKENADFICYSVGIKDSPDTIAARKASELLGVTLKYKELDLDELEKLFVKTARLFGKPNVLSVGVASVIIAAAELAKQDHIASFFGGLGSEEIFAGYERHANAKDINEECWRGLKAMWARDFVREFTVAKHLGISVLVPFLDEDLIVSAMALEGNCKIKDGHKKFVLREIAEELGLPGEIAWRKKQAAQYGSKFDLAMEKISRKNGFKSKHEWLESL